MEGDGLLTERPSKSHVAYEAHCLARWAPFWPMHARSFLPTKKRRILCRLFCFLPAVISCFIAVLLVFTALFRPSYTNLPAHYKTLENKCSLTTEPGRGNAHKEKVFIAAAIRDFGGRLADGAWGDAILDLVDLLGPDNVHLSIYENDADPAASAALAGFREKVQCNSTIVSEHLGLEGLPLVTVPSGEKRTKRIAFLAEVRNRALRPLESQRSVHFDKLLFVNDVVFNPIDAVHLLFSTNVDASGRSQYGAVCALDFINPFKFYDTFATRDFEGYGMGIPFFPWFTDAGSASSRRDVLDQKDAVRVRACWGGMTAFEAKWFMESPGVAPLPGGAVHNPSPLRFRYEEDPFWDASECCLIHADLTNLRHGRNISTTTGIFTNPYIRVAYDSRTLGWLSLTRRTERLYSFVHNKLSHAVGLPYHNTRRLEQPGQEVVEKVWFWDRDQTKQEAAQGGVRDVTRGSYRDVKRIAPAGRFCGDRALLVLAGEKKWTRISPPA